MNMQYSQSGLKITEGFEGCKLAAYLDQRGIPTIGYGHTQGVSLGMTCTQDQADAWLQTDMQTAVNAVNRLVTVTLSQAEFDALVDFVFNAGQGNFAGSTLLRLLNSGDYDGAANEFDKWDHCGAEICAGLLRRRKAETSEFTGEGQ
jgi:lysozyme